MFSTLSPLSLVLNFARASNQLLRTPRKNGHRRLTLACFLCCILVLKYCFVTIQAMQSFDTHGLPVEEPQQTPQTVSAGRVEDFPEGTCKTIELSPERELALYRVNGEFYATENFCPHKGAPLAAGKLCDHVIECEWHGWQFDVRTGQCLTVSEKISTYAVVVENGMVKILM